MKEIIRKGATQECCKVYDRGENVFFQLDGRWFYFLRKAKLVDRSVLSGKSREICSFWYQFL